MEHYQVEGGKTEEAGEDPCAPLNQILHVSSYITNAVGHASRNITFYQHIHGLLLDGKIRCRICKTISIFDAFCDHGMNLNKESINCQISSDAEKSVAQKQLRKKNVKHANSKANLTLTNFSWRERNKQ